VIMKYTTTAIVELTSGILKLSKDQARRRMRNLKALKDGSFEILRAVQFKAGETFDYDGDIPKTLANSLSEFGSGITIAEKAAVAAAKKKKQKEPDSTDAEEGDKDKAE